MKAIIHKKYGPPNVVELTEVLKPTPENHEILIKVYASTVNRTDAGFRSAEYFISRFWSGLFKPKCQTLGSEFSGIVEVVGKDVSEFFVGDKVFGFNDISFGGHAEYVIVNKDSAIEKIPQGMDIYDAAAITEGAHYALCNIRASKITSGQKALVYGATGAIGSAAVQLLKHFGVFVVAVCNTKNVDLVKQLGANEVIDYQTQDFRKTTHMFDFVFDAVGKTSFGACKSLLTPKGIYVSTELGKNAENIYLALLTPFFRGRKVIFPIPTIKRQDVSFLKQLVEKGAFKPVIDSYYPMHKIVEAYTYVETGQKTGNVVLKIVDN